MKWKVHLEQERQVGYVMGRNDGALLGASFVIVTGAAIAAAFTIPKKKKKYSAHTRRIIARNNNNWYCGDGVKCV